MTLLEKPSAIFVPYADILVKVSCNFYRPKGVWKLSIYNDKSKFWVRPANMFEDLVEINGEKVPRFVWVREK